MLRAIDRCPEPVIARVQGAALGGGVGLGAVGDIVDRRGRCVFGFTEAKLGILPAVISPFVACEIGVSHARALFLTGERFSAARAQAWVWSTASPRGGRTRRARSGASCARSTVQARPVAAAKR